MKIGIIGAGEIGLTVAQLGVRAGHSIAISNTHGPAALAARLQHLDSTIQATTIEDAAVFGELVLVAIPFGVYQSVPSLSLVGKIMIDAMNYSPPRDGQIEFGTRTSSELVAEHFKGTRMVKAFNTLWSQTLATEARPEDPLAQRLVLFLAGDDVQAKGVVAHFIETIGFAPLDTGTLREGGRVQEPDSPVYNQPLTLEQARQQVSSSYGNQKRV